MVDKKLVKTEPGPVQTDDSGVDEVLLPIADP